jgi:hypothetical protein
MNSEATVSIADDFQPRGWSRRAAPSRMVLLLLCVLIPAVSRASLIWDSDLGTSLPISGFLSNGSPDPSDGLQPVNLQPGYSFPFDGTTYNSITVATSGFIWLAGTNGAQCCDLGDETNTLDLFENGPPRIAPGWADLLPNEGGSIDVNQITDGFGSRTDITYFQVATDSNDVSPVTFQLQLFNSGVIVFSYETFDSTSLGPNPAALIGLAALLGTPQSVDLTNLPISTSANQIYDYLTTVGGFNLDGQSIVFTPTANGGWAIGSDLPTPEPATLIPAGGILFLIAVIRIKQKSAIPSTKL